MIEMSDSKFFELVIVVLGVITLFVVVALLVGFPVMWLWNWLMPVIFGFPTINFWQAVGLNLLSSCLIRSTSNSSKSSK